VHDRGYELRPAGIGARQVGARQISALEGCVVEGRASEIDAAQILPVLEATPPVDARGREVAAVRQCRAADHTEETSQAERLEASRSGHRQDLTASLPALKGFDGAVGAVSAIAR
jgi:hypothetical protein